MHCTCPRCRRGTIIEKEVGDFPVRCQNCGALLRRRRKAHISHRGNGNPLDAVAADTPAFDAPLVPPSPTLQRGMLARLLIHGPPATADTPRRSLEPFQARTPLRRGFLQRAVREGRRRALDALNWAGFLSATIVAATWLLRIHAA